MADEAEDVLELDTFDEVEDEDTDATPPETDGEEPEGDEETVIRFDGEDEDEAAPASESESSVIREMRRKLREQERELNSLRKGTQPAKVELGPKPTLESCEYDEERFETELDTWKARKAKADAEAETAKEAEERQRAEWAETVEGYKSAKADLAIAGYDDAEAEVFSVLAPEVQALIVRQKASAPALVYALSRSPSKLEELSKLNLADAAVMVGELKAKVKVEKRTKLPSPDKPIIGRTNSTGGNLDKLLASARKTGDYTAYYRAKRAAGS
jgi:hypothetical protein